MIYSNEASTCSAVCTKVGLTCAASDNLWPKTETALRASLTTLYNTNKQFMADPCSSYSSSSSCLGSAYPYLYSDSNSCYYNTLPVSSCPSLGCNAQFSSSSNQFCPCLLGSVSSSCPAGKYQTYGFTYQSNFICSECPSGYTSNAGSFYCISTSSSSRKSLNPDALSGGAIAGIVIGVLAALAIAAAVAFQLLRRKGSTEGLAANGTKDPSSDIGIFIIII